MCRFTSENRPYAGAPPAGAEHREEEMLRLLGVFFLLIVFLRLFHLKHEFCPENNNSCCLLASENSPQEIMAAHLCSELSAGTGKFRL